MKLSDRLRKAGAKAEALPAFIPRRIKKPEEADTYQELKSRIHSRLIERLDLSRLEAIEQEQLEEEIRQIVQDLIAHEPTPISSLERENLIVEVQYEVLGLGPLEPLLQDPTISDILVNSPQSVYVERFGKLEKVNIVFKNQDHLMQIIHRIVAQVGRRIDESSPMVDARLPDGSRINAIIPPVALEGPALSIRRFALSPYKMKDILNFHTLSSSIAELIQAAVKGKLNILISGGTGSGKTTLLNILSGFIPPSERIITIEDAAELQLQQPHVIRLESRPPNIEGKGLITVRDLLRNALRMRPDRIIVGEVRGGEALDMLQAMNTGHEGSLSTLHANTPREALNRLETMVLMGGIELPQRVIREHISTALNMIVQIERLTDGSRKITSVSEALGMEHDKITMQEIFVFERTGVSEDGKVLGSHKPTGIRPRFSERLQRRGIELPPSLFEA